MEDPVWVGRASEQAVLSAELEVACSLSRPRLVVVTGEAGIGKTTLVNRWAECADVKTIRFWGSEDEAVQDLAAARLLLATVTSSSEHLNHDDEEQFALGLLIVEAIAGATEGERGVVLVLDDAQWIDPPSRAALGFALRRLVAEPVLCVVSGRRSRELVDWTDRLREQLDGTLLHLSGLAAAELTALARQLGQPLNDHAISRVSSVTGGNPLHACALIRELGSASLESGSDPLPAPTSYASIVASRYRSMPETGCRVVAAASVFGPETPTRIAVALAGIDEPDGPDGYLAAVAAGEEAGLIELTGEPVGTTIRFRHALDRSGVYHLLTPPERSEMHQRAARFVEPTLGLDHRVAAALGVDEELADEVANVASIEARSGSSEAASAHWLHAARLTRDRSRRDRWSVDAMLSVLRSGNVHRATQLVNAVRQAEASGSRSLALGLLAMFTGDQAEAERHLAEAWQATDPSSENAGGDPAVASESAAFLAQLCSIQIRNEDTIDWAQRALEASDDPFAAPAFSVLVCQLWFKQRHDEVAALLDGYTPANTGPVSRDSDLHLVRGLIAMWSDEYLDGVMHIGRAVAACQPMPTSRTGLMSLGYLAEAAFRAGRLDEAISRSELAVSLANATDQTWLKGFLHAAAVLPAAVRGRWEEADAHLERSAEHVRQLGDAASLGHLTMAAALLGYCRRDPSAVIVATEPAVADHRRLVFDHPSVHFQWRVRRIGALIELGTLDAAERETDEYEREVHRWDLPIRRADALRCRGLLAQAHRAGVDAVALYDEAALLLDDRHAPWERAELDLARGALVRRMGRRTEAVRHLHAAHEAFASMGALPFVERCQRELAASGLKPVARSQPSARFDLTPQELTVARLVSEGRTNREVAAELMVSVKTVEFHLSAVFRKLGISKRRQLHVLEPSELVSVRAL